MEVRAVELGNICATLFYLQTFKISLNDLKSILRRIMLLDSISDVNTIIKYLIGYRLIEYQNELYKLTKRGILLGKAQGEANYYLTVKAKEYIIKELVCKIEYGDLCCHTFISKFKPESKYNSFIYIKSDNVDFNTLNWMKNLTSVGLLIHEEELLIINNKYLSVIADMLKEARSLKINFPIEENERNEIGECAERLAEIYEVNRLRKNGNRALSELVNRISKIDPSAGYDIISYNGTKKNPTNHRYIEVKGTKSSIPRFIWSQNERYIASKHKNKYYIYLFTNVNVEKCEADGPQIIMDPLKNLSKLDFNSEPIDIFYWKD
jgi:hypothetical protein